MSGVGPGPALLPPLVMSVTLSIGLIVWIVRSFVLAFTYWVYDMPPFSIPQGVDAWVRLHEIFNLCNPLNLLVSTSLLSMKPVTVCANSPNSIVVDSDFSA